MELPRFTFGLVLALVVLLYLAITSVLFLISALTPSKSSVHRISAFYARSLAGIAALLCCAGYGVFASLALRVVGKAGLSQWTVARAFKWTMWLVTGIWFEVVEGEEYLLERPAVLIGNHQSELDILFLGAVFPKWCSVTAKSSLVWTPVLGLFLILSKTVLIDRKNRESALKAFERAAKHMHGERQSVFIFPEGTRSYYDHADLLPFKKGAFHLAVQAQVPIVPIVAANYSYVLNLKERIFRSGNVPVKVLPPVSTKGLTAHDVDRLLHDIREDMLKTIRQMELERKGECKGEEKMSDGVAVSTGADVGKRANKKAIANGI